MLDTDFRKHCLHLARSTQEGYIQAGAASGGERRLEKQMSCNDMKQSGLRSVMRVQLGNYESSVRYAVQMFVTKKLGLRQVCPPGNNTIHTVRKRDH